MIRVGNTVSKHSEGGEKKFGVNIFDDDDAKFYL